MGPGTELSASDAPTATNPKWGGRHSIELLRVGAGFIWLINLLFIVNPQNQYWSTFSSTALSFAPTTVGGPGLAQFVAAHPLLFAWGIALLTGYLAVALLLGLTTRLACFLGSFFSAILLATQFGSTFLFPGGTDVGAHPLYILVYAVLIVGGAGETLSVDQWARSVLRAHRLARPALPSPKPRPWSAAVPTQFLLAYFVAGTLIALGVGFGLVLAVPSSPAESAPSTSTSVHYVNLSVNLNATTGWPQFSPANFSVPAGPVEFTIVDNDSMMSWAGCPCPVRGTVGGTELVNGTPMRMVPGTNVAHTFNIPNLDLQILSPGQSVVQFEIVVSGPGNYTWFCIAPCGAGPDPYTTPPMNAPGYMTGTMTVT
ncbi:MAG TPA: hypothetical protein VGS23_01395 [Thermoplasmata archaeon]|nr:hypothetical protein [Thermoplasmata archaeon]